jgi:arylsulfatase A-like enzyme
MRWKGSIPAGTVSDACLNTPDIMPTLLGLAGLGSQIPHAVEGMNLRHFDRQSLFILRFFYLQT